MNHNIIRDLERENFKQDLPSFRVGDSVRVHIRINDGKRSRIQVFEGLVIKIQNGGISKRFTVRKLTGGVGVEKTFPIHSPKVEKIEKTRQGKIRRAKLFYIRKRVGKRAKVKEKLR